ncbi:MAG: hypothetical protein LBT12_00200, partial [Oscillospiraceae bacterium]|nr:hypothetical protein [Oscillospiraceae bacterium]
MKKFIALALALTLALSLAACGVQDKIQNAVEGAVKDAISGAEGGIPAASGGDISEEDLDKAWDEMQDWAHEQGWDGEGYHFPQVDSMREWPPAAVWTELGLPDMTPDKMEDGEIYNDGNTHIDGY